MKKCGNGLANSQWTKLITQKLTLWCQVKRIFLSSSSWGFFWHRLLVLLDIVVLTEKDAHLSSLNCFVVQSEWVEAFVTVV